MLRPGNLRRESQKGFLDANSYPAQKEKIVDNKKRIGVTLTECFCKKEIGFSIAECLPVGKAKKEIFANAGAKRNSIAH